MQYFINNYCNSGILKELFNNIFNTKVKNITYLDKCKLHKMPEYNFSIYKYNVVLENFYNYTIFVKEIDEDKIEENLFCYWFFCEEYYGIKNKKYVSRANILNIAKKNYETKFNMEIINKNNIVWKTSLIDIIDLKKYFEKNINKSDTKQSNENKKYEKNKSLFIAVI